MQNVLIQLKHKKKLFDHTQFKTKLIVYLVSQLGITFVAGLN